VELLTTDGFCSRESVIIMSEIAKLEALEILDSRGNPTLAVTATLSNGVKATAKVPSGASTANGKPSN